MYFITTDFNLNRDIAQSIKLSWMTTLRRTMPHVSETNNATRHQRDDTKKQSKKPKLAASHTCDKAIPTTIYDCL
jgi:hypothetical protein